MGFEPTRAVHIGLAVQHLNVSLFCDNLEEKLTTRMSIRPKFNSFHFFKKMLGSIKLKLKATLDCRGLVESKVIMIRNAVKIEREL